MDIDVSIIMISHNKYPQNLFSLYALENQTFDKEKMEVILVDDCSADRTSELIHYQAPFKFKYLRCNQNVGRSKAKNLGSDAANGKILIFIDSEMLLDPDFVRQHYEWHQAEKEIAVTGCYSHYNTFTVLDRNYNRRQLKQLQQLMLKNGVRMASKSQEPFQKQIEQILKNKQKIKLFTKEGIQNRQYQKLSYHSPFYPEIFRRFGPQFQGFHLPWIFVITHNLSVKKSTMQKVGPFYEGFDGYGCEDWEFGYRLYKSGMKIIDNPNVKVFHQEHPRSLRNQQADGIKNYRIFFHRHREFDVGVVSLCWTGFNFSQCNDLIAEVNWLTSQYPGQFENLLAGFNLIFDFIFARLLEGKPVAQLVKHSGLAANRNRYKGFKAELERLGTIAQTPELQRLLKWILTK